MTVAYNQCQTQETARLLSTYHYFYACSNVTANRSNLGLRITPEDSTWYQKLGGNHQLVEHLLYLVVATSCCRQDKGSMVLPPRSDGSPEHKEKSRKDKCAKALVCLLKHKLNDMCMVLNKFVYRKTC